MALYVVTGGCGFVGSHLVDGLIQSGHRVRVLDDLSTGNRANLPPSAELVVGDIRDPGVVSEALTGADGCFHLAALVSISRCTENWRYGHDVNLTGALNVFQQASGVYDGRPIPVVYASSAAIYGEASDTPVVEEMPASPISSYGADKAACEAHARAVARALGVPITGCRLFNVYGPRQDPGSIYSGVVAIFCDRLLKGQPVDVYGDGTQTRDFIHVSDVIAYLLRAMWLPSKGGEVYNVCTGNSISIIELAEVIAELCGSRLEVRVHAQRADDIRHSVGNPGRAIAQFDYRAKVNLRTGLADLIHSLRIAHQLSSRTPTFIDNAARREVLHPRRA